METLQQTIPELSEFVPSPATAEGNEVELQPLNNEAQLQLSLINAAELQGSEKPKHPHLKGAMETAKNQGIVEIVGLGVDAGLIALGGIGIGAMKDVAAREMLASGVDAGVLGKLAKHNHETSTANSEKVPRGKLKTLGRLGVTMAAAIAAQKLGPGVFEHVSAQASHGLEHYGIMLGSKAGATTGVNSFFKRKIKLA